MRLLSVRPGAVSHSTPTLPASADAYGGMAVVNVVRGLGLYALCVAAPPSRRTPRATSPKVFHSSPRIPLLATVRCIVVVHRHQHGPGDPNRLAVLAKLPAFHLMPISFAGSCTAQRCSCARRWASSRSNHPCSAPLHVVGIQRHVGPQGCPTIAAEGDIALLS